MLDGRRFRDLRDERGLSVLEILIASGLFMSLLVAVLSMLDSGTKVERAQQARHDALLDVREALTRMTTDVRQAVAVNADSTRTRLTIETLRSGAEHWTVFEFANGELLKRTCEALPCAEHPVVVTSHLVTGSFCYDPPGCVAASPPDTVSTIRVSLAVRPEASSASDVVLATDVELRNM